MGRPEKTCDACGRTISWRWKWGRDWQDVRFCSRDCRKRGTSEFDRCLEQTILELLADRAPGATICPSEAARAAAEDDDWRALMEPTRRAARRLVDAGRVEITKRGEVVDPSSSRGPIRIRLT